MAQTRVRISDLAGNEHRALLPHDVPMERLIPALLAHLKRPVIDENGNPISYRLYAGNQPILPGQTLAEASVAEDALLTLTEESKAGG